MAVPSYPAFPVDPYARHARAVPWPGLARMPSVGLEAVLRSRPDSEPLHLIRHAKRDALVPGIDHYAVLAGHLPPRDDSIVLDYQHGQGPRVTTLVELGAGMDVFLIETVEPGQLPLAHARLREVLDKRLPYDALEANCQHAAVYVARGAWESPQVRGLGTVLLVGAGVAIFSDLGKPKRTARRRKPG